MKYIIVLFTVVLSNLQPAFSADRRLIQAIISADKNSDYLAIRLLIKQIFKEGINHEDWKTIRQVLQRRPQIGYDLVYKWDRVTTHDAKVEPSEAQVNNFFDEADALLEAERFEEAFTRYQSAAKFLKNEIVAGHKDNLLVYTTAIHSMARALYGAKRFNEALEVYSWIDRKYPKYRKVLFEKMWTAFRAGKMDMAMGAIASQTSSYFTDLLEPEAYVVQIYIYKTLCRDEEIKRVRKTLAQFKTRLEASKGNYTYQEWAQSDIETLSLLNLSKTAIREETYGVLTIQMKRDEQAMIRSALEKRFVAEKARLYQYVDKAIAYSFLALAADRRIFHIDVETDRAELAKKGKEFWPVGDGEDWLDEIGGHLYIGESLCSKK